MGKKIDLAVGILNGAVGDYLVKRKNPLATEMTLVHDGEPLALKRSDLLRAHPEATPHIVVLVHGVMCTETIFQLDDGTDYGVLLRRDRGFTPLYVRYNSGLSIGTNGESLARLLESLVAEYPVPVEKIVLLGYSMGGLLVRSACHFASEAGHAWLPLVQSAIYIGTPHLGSPLERIGRTVAKVLHTIDDPYTRLAGQIADLRSEGVKALGDPAHPFPLLTSIQHYLIAGATSSDRWVAALFGDAVVSIASATGGACVDKKTSAFPPAHIRICHGVNHAGLPRHSEVYEQVRAWCEGGTP